MKKIVAIILLAALCSCSNRTTVDAKVVDASALDSEISQFVQNLPPLRGEFYIAPSRDWLEKIRSVSVAEAHITKNNYPWWDCDNFAINMVVVVSREPRNSHHNIAFGIAYGYRAKQDALGFVGDVGMHAVNIVRCSDGQWYFLEPQTGYVLPVAESKGIFEANQVLF